MSDQKRELKLEDLVGYLPYGLKVLVDISGFPKSHWLRQISTTAIEPLIGCKKGKFYIGGDKIDIDSYYDFKPLLRPLSDITKEIEHNGKTIYLLVLLAERNGIKLDSFSCISNGQYITFEYTSQATRFVRTQNKILIYLDCSQNPQYVNDFLLKWHFDIYGLIEAGLAVNLNDIKK
jgi:hypothetical protein